MSFEKEYYESPEFWSEGMVADLSNTARINETIALIPDDSRSLLDVGCGNGVFPNKLIKEKPELKVVATDRSKEALKHVLSEKFESDISNIPVNDLQYDCVTCLQVLEHIPVQMYDASLKELARVAKKYVLISVPFNEVLENSFTKCPYCKSTFNLDLHLRSYTLETIENLFSKHHFKLEKHINVVKQKKLLGIELYINLLKSFSTPQPEKFNSPICPVCGFVNKDFNIKKPAQNTDELSKNQFKKTLKSIWPKVEIPGYWIIALYQRIP
jgi:ubiquinone/menaquinone biosynthesis C-methylase UbiE